MQDGRDPGDRSLLEHCELDDVEGAKYYLDPLKKQIEVQEKAGKDSSVARDQLLVKLFVDDFEKDTPIEAALRIGSNRGADLEGNTAIRMYLLECLYTAGWPVSRFPPIHAFGPEHLDHPAHVKRLARTFQQQLLRYMALCGGGLMRPYATYETAAGDEKEKSHDRPLRNFYLAELCDLSHEVIGLCVAQGFNREYEQMRELRKEWQVAADTRTSTSSFRSGGGYSLMPSLSFFSPSRGQLPSSFPNERDRGMLGNSLLTALKIAKDADDYADRLTAKLQLHDAAQQTELSRRLQRATASALDALGSEMTYLIIRHHRGQEAMQLATLEGMRDFVSTGAVRGALRRIWYGEKLYAVVESPSLKGITHYVLWVVYNLLLLPLVAATPFVPHKREDAEGWLKAFGARENYLLQVASFQAFSFQVIDLSLTLYLTFAPAVFPSIGLCWAISALWFEIIQIQSALEDQKLSQRISGWKAYLTEDMFNWIDVPSLMLTAATFGLLCSGANLGDALDEAIGADLVVMDEDGGGQLALRRLKARGGDGKPSSTNFNATAFELARSETIDEPLVYYGEWVLCAALLLMWLRQLRFLGLASSAMSDLVQMLASMLIDVVKFMGLFIVVLLSFAASLAHLITEADVEAAASTECGEVMYRLNSVPAAVFFLFEGALLGDVAEPLACIRGSQRHGTMGVVLLFLFMILSVLMLLNMIIAIMGQTFADYHDQASESSALYFARVVVDWESQTEPPPLMNLLAIPYLLLSSVRNAAERASELLRGCAGGDAASNAGSGGAQDSTTPAPETRRRSTLVRSKTTPMHFNPLDEEDSDAEDESEVDEMPTLDEMKDAIAGTLEDIFGSWESTAWLIDSAVTMLTSHVGDVRDDVKKLCKHVGLKNEDLRPKKRRASISAQNELNRRSSVKSMIPQELLETGSANDKVSSQALPPPQVAPSANAPPAVSVTSAAAEPPSSTSARELQA